MKDLRIIYMGTPDFAVMPLRALVEGGYNVVGVVTAEDKPSGRGLTMQQSAVKKYAIEVGLKVLQPSKLRSPEFIDELSALKPDLGIVIAFRMLPEVVWSMPRLGTFNLHASLLPEYRGAAPINWAVINGEKRTGVTTFMLNHEIDKGDIIARAEIDIAPDETVGELHDRLMVVGTELVLKSVKMIEEKEIVPLPQIDSNVLKPAPKIFRETCRIEWNNDLDSIYNKIRGLSPYPAAWTMFDGRQMKIYRVQKERVEHKELAGAIKSDGTYLKVACKGGYIVITELQSEGKKRMVTEDFLRGCKNIPSIME